MKKWDSKLDYEFNHPEDGFYGDDINISSQVLSLFKITGGDPEETLRQIIPAADKLDEALGGVEITQQYGGEISEIIEEYLVYFARALLEEILKVKKSHRLISLKLEELAAGKIPFLAIDAFRFLGKWPSRFWTVRQYNMALRQDLSLHNALTDYPEDSPIVKMRAEGLIGTLRQAEGNELVLLPYLEKLASGGDHACD